WSSRERDRVMTTRRIAQRIRRAMLLTWRLRCGRTTGPMRGAQTIESFSGNFGFLGVRTELDHALPRLLGAVEVLLAEGANDADIQERLRVLRIDRERSIELRQRAIRLVRVVIRNSEIRAGIHVLRVDLDRLFVPAHGLIV